MKSKFNDIINNILNESYVDINDGHSLDVITRKLKEIGNKIAKLFPREAEYLISLDTELNSLKDRLGRD